MKVGMVASSGGHLAQLHWMEPWWRQHDRFWVSFDTPDAMARLAGERVYWAHHPTNRHLGNMARNTALAARVLAAEQPDLLVSNGAGVALPFLGLGKAMGIGVVWLEVYDRIDTASLTGRLVRRWADAVVLQWASQRAAYPQGHLLGPIR